MLLFEQTPAAADSADTRKRWGKSPRESGKFGPIAQLVEHPTLNRLVVGSIPSRSTKNNT